MSTTPAFRADAQTAIIGNYLKQLRLPAIAREYLELPHFYGQPMMWSVQRR